MKEVEAERWTSLDRSVRFEISPDEGGGAVARVPVALTKIRRYAG